MYTGLATRFETAEKALAEERTARQIANQELWAVRDSATALSQELQAAKDYAAAANRELSSNVATLDELSGRELAAQDALRSLAEEKRILERELSSTQKMFAERDTSSSKVIASAVAHAVAVLKSHVPDLDLELLHEDYW
jgi:uncharacterized protein (DUF3084 family)